MNADIEIFKSLFKGRNDVFAIRWEKDGKSGYTPAYDFNWDEFRLHKAKGGSLKNFPNKVYSPLTDKRILNHLDGKEVLGIYPLLLDNCSGFIAADFDGTADNDESWKIECRQFLKICKENQVPVYLERSRSGAGGHVWMFFESLYPAVKSRKLFKKLLELSGAVLEKNTTFDRLFPNQDYHSGKELGNLIALPLQKLALQNYNSCFLHPETFEPYKEQFQFLKTIEKITQKLLDEVFNKITGDSYSTADSDMPASNSSNKLHLILDNQITIPKKGLSNVLHRYLKDSLNFINPEYFIKKASGKNTYNTERYFVNISDEGGYLGFPRGFIANLVRYCKEQNIAFQLEDKRVKLEPVEYKFSGALLPFQQETVAVTEKKDFGVIVAPPGSGKTVMALYIIARKNNRR